MHHCFGWLYPMGCSMFWCVFFCMLRTICFLLHLHTMVCLELFSTTFLQLPLHSAPSSTHCQCQGLIRTPILCADPHAWVILNNSVNPCSKRISLYHCPLDLCRYKLWCYGIWSRVQLWFSFLSFILSTECELNRVWVLNEQWKMHVIELLIMHGVENYGLYWGHPQPLFALLW